MYHYEIDGECYLLKDDHENTIWGGERVAIAFSYFTDKEMAGTLHKHGDPELVNEWANNAKLIYKEAGYNDMADAIIVVSGKFDIVELNKIVGISGYVGNWYDTKFYPPPDPETLTCFKCK